MLSSKWNILRLIYFIPFWILLAPLKLILVLLGPFLISIAALSKAYVKIDDNISKPDDGPIYAFTWKIMRPWGNHTDGIANRNYRKFKNLFWQIMYWSAWRNPANGTRTMQPYSLIINPKNIKYFGSTRPLNKYKDRTAHWYFCWHGLYWCGFFQFYIWPNHLRRLWIGWKLKPQDFNGLKADDYRRKGAALTFQFKRIHIL